MKKITKLVIQREKWGAGSLFRSDDRMCCLGHLAMACGASKKKLFDKADLKHALKDYAPGNFYWSHPGDVQDLAIDINDDSKMSIKEKEQRLKILFKAHGIKLTFRGKIATRTEFMGDTA